MDIKEIEALLNEAIKKPEDEAIKGKYAEAVTTYLKDNKSSDGLITVIVRGIDLDRAANYFDYLGDVSKNDMQSIWKQVRENKEITNNPISGLKFVSGLLGLSFMKVGNMDSQSGNLISKIMMLIKDEKKSLKTAEYAPVVLDYFVDDVLSIATFPKWDSFGLLGETSKAFAETLLVITSCDKDKYKNIRQWAETGINCADRQIELEKIESKIPKSRIDDLQQITDHYKSVEKQLRDDEYMIAKLEKTIGNLKEEIKELNSGKRLLENKVEHLNSELEAHQKRIEDRDKEIEERKKLNEAADALKKNDEEGLLKDIANELKAEYRDFADSEHDKMDEQLGEIYREKLRNVFSILEKKGIRME